MKRLAFRRSLSALLMQHAWNPSVCLHANAWVCISKACTATQPEKGLTQAVFLGTKTRKRVGAGAVRRGVGALVAACWGRVATAHRQGTAGSHKGQSISKKTFCQSNQAASRVSS